MTWITALSDLALDGKSSSSWAVGSEASRLNPVPFWRWSATGFQNTAGLEAIAHLGSESAPFALKLQTTPRLSSASLDTSFPQNSLAGLGSDLTPLVKGLLGQALNTATNPTLNATVNATTGSGLKFVFNAAAGTPQAVIDGFAAAGAVWSSVLKDNVTVVIDISYNNLGSSILGGTVPTLLKVSYDTFKRQLTNDVRSADDQAAVLSLSPGSAFDLLINETRQNGGSSAYYLDNNGSSNNQRVTLTSANLKALSPFPILPNVTDARITFSNQVKWDFNPVDGIEPDAFDFVGTAVHEIGHALGFMSSVNSLDSLTGLGLSALVGEDFHVPTALDLFRFSSESAALGVIDMAADPRNKYFSVDRGQTAIAPFSTGVYTGNGDQAGHWLDSTSTSPLGLMDPTLGYGEPGTLTALDLRALDVVGWNLS